MGSRGCVNPCLAPQGAAWFQSTTKCVGSRQWGGQEDPQCPFRQLRIISWHLLLHRPVMRCPGSWWYFQWQHPELPPAPMADASPVFCTTDAVTSSLSAQRSQENPRPCLRSVPQAGTQLISLSSAALPDKRRDGAAWRKGEENISSAGSAPIR